MCLESGVRVKVIHTRKKETQANANSAAHDSMTNFRLEIVRNLTGASVASIDHAWGIANSALAGRPIVVVLTAVAEAGDDGRGLLMNGHRCGVRVIARSTGSRTLPRASWAHASRCLRRSRVGGSGSATSSDAGLLPPSNEHQFRNGLKS